MKYDKLVFRVRVLLILLFLIFTLTTWAQPPPGGGGADDEPVGGTVPIGGKTLLLLLGLAYSLKRYLKPSVIKTFLRVYFKLQYNSFFNKNQSLRIILGAFFWLKPEIYFPSTKFPEQEELLSNDNYTDRHFCESRNLPLWKT